MNKALVYFDYQQSFELGSLPFEQRHAILAVLIPRRLAFLVEEQIPHRLLALKRFNLIKKGSSQCQE